MPAEVNLRRFESTIKKEREHRGLSFLTSSLHYAKTVAV
jgi:hypothetical protein